MVKKSKLNRYTAFDVFLIFFMILIMIIMLYPIWLMVVVSLSDGKEVMRGGIYFWPRGFTLEAYTQILHKPDFFPSYGNTIFYTFFGTIYNVVMTALCAYPLSRRDFFGRGFFTGIVLVTMFFSGGMIPSFLLVRSLGMLDTRWALIIPGAISTWNMIVMRTFFQNLPESLTESAYIDGANDLQILRSIVLPLSAPIFATMTLFYAVGHWNSWVGALIYLNSKALMPVQILLRNIVISGEMEELNDAVTRTEAMVVATNLKYSTIIVVMLPILMVYPFVQKHFTKGVMIGALKG